MDCACILRAKIALLGRPLGQRQNAQEKEQGNCEKAGDLRRGLRRRRKSLVLCRIRRPLHGNALSQTHSKVARCVKDKTAMGYYLHADGLYKGAILLS